MPRQTVERELKLTIPPGFRLPRLPGSVLPPRTLRSVYYDTADLRLTRAGITLRHRTEGRRRVWQLTLQQGDARLEVECAGKRGEPPGQLRDALTAHLRAKPIVPVATLRTRRGGIRVHGRHGPVADVTVDRVAVLEDGRVVQRFAEVEIEQLGMDDEALAHLASALRGAGAGEHDHRPKLLRALRLEPSPSPEADPEASSPQLLATALQRQLDALLAHDPGTRLDAEPEHLHQMRVATRRLRAYLRAARPMLQREWTDALRGELGWLGRALGPARDHDVLLQLLRNQARSLRQRDRQAFGGILRSLKAGRRAARETVQQVLGSDRYLKLIDRLADEVATPPVVGSTASLVSLAAGEFRKVQKAMQRFAVDMSDHDLHRLRIRGKRARYAAELAQTAVGKPARRFIKQAKAFQDCLGAHQDAVAAENRLRGSLENTGNAAILAAGMMIERLHQRRREARAALPKIWKKLERRGQKAWRQARPAGSDGPSSPSA